MEFRSGVVFNIRCILVCRLQCASAARARARGVGARTPSFEGWEKRAAWCVEKALVAVSAWNGMVDGVNLDERWFVMFFVRLLGGVKDWKSMFGRWRGSLYTVWKADR